ncbi:MAG TPA: DUF1015 domain-containing protein [Thermodesulfovibrionales bacterium]|nr:DUF1015 domain-containing protein [Thermodesulfovibrionales bacterium]
MAEVIPFRGILYNASRVSGDDVVAPPYDIITPDLRATLYRKSPYNIVRVDCGEEYSGDNEAENKYVRASRFLKQWQKEGIFVQPPKRSFYAYAMDYAIGKGRERLSGFFGLVKLEELGRGVYPHEETQAKPKVDRLNLMTACEANTSPIFSLYNSPQKKASGVLEMVMKGDPYIEANDLGGAVHRLWVIEQEDEIDAIRTDLDGKDVFIADGHHRYETALEFHRLRGESQTKEPCNYVLMFLANIADEGITILPTHRIVKHKQENILDVLSHHFEIEAIAPERDIIAAMRSKVPSIGVALKGDAMRYLLRFNGTGAEDLDPSLQGLDVVILHELILKKLLKVSEILYEMDAARAGAHLKAGEYDAVFFLNPTRVEDVERVALLSRRMPPKSTYFYPKVMTGFVINSFKNSL